MHRGSRHRRGAGSASAAGRAALVLLAAALVLLGGPAGAAAAHCHSMQAHADAAGAGHAAAGAGHHAAGSAHDPAEAVPAAPAMPTWCAQQCADTPVCLDGAESAAATAPSASPSPQAPLTPVRRVPPPTALSIDAAPVGVVPPWTHPTLDRLEILRI